MRLNHKVKFKIVLRCFK